MSVSIAGVIVCTAYALLAKRLAPLVQGVPDWQRIAGAVVVFGLIFLMMRWFTKRSLAKSNNVEDGATDGEPSAPVNAPAAPTPVTVSADSE